MAGIRAVLFDFGNTLFGHDSLAATIERCAADIGSPTDATMARSIATAIDRAAHTEAELSMLRDLDDSVWDARWRVLYDIADGWVPGLGSALMTDMHAPMSWMPFRRTIATIATLAAGGVSIGVVSNTGWDVRAVFRAYGIEPSIDDFVLSYEVGLVKPNPAIFVEACRRLGSSPGETLMVGDDPRADSGATAAGLPVLLLPIVEPGTDNGIGVAIDAAGVRPLPN
ncbi:MAG: HAD family hydrolase [Ilumatobacteraceae bacterium]